MHNIIQLSDIHLYEDLITISKGRSPATQLTNALRHIENNFNNHKIIILTGDLVATATSQTYQQLASFFNDISAQIYVIPGNHDDPNLLYKYFMGKNIYHDKEIILDNWLLLLVDSSVPGKTLGSGRVSSDELKRIDNLLSKNLHKDVLIFMHHPLIPFGAAWFQATCLENNKEFMELIEIRPNVKAIIHGHAHTQHTYSFKNRLFISSPSTWVQVDHFDDKNITITEEDGGYNLFKLGKNNEFSWQTFYFNNKI